MKNTIYPKMLFLLTLFFIIFNVGNSQVLINTTGGVPDGSAMLDIESDSKGLLIPRL